MAQLNANLTGVEGQVGFEVLPPGWYPAQVVDSEIKDGPKGSYIQWTFELTGKPNRIWDVMSLGNEISMKRLKGLAIAAGHPNPNFIGDTEELHGKQCMIRLKVETDPNGHYEPKNKISAFKALDGNGAAPPQIAEAPIVQTVAQRAVAALSAAAATPVQPPPPQAKTRMPWEKA